MNPTVVSKPSLAWKIMILAPGLVGLGLMLVAGTRLDANAIRLRIIANFVTPIVMIVVGAYWVESKKASRWGMAILVLGGMVLGYGLSVLFRIL
jgi:hypothetical protein